MTHKKVFYHGTEVIYMFRYAMLKIETSKEGVSID